jgi:hypothetical protein
LQRVGRSPHQALDALTAGIQRKKVNRVLDADIRGFFDNMSHEWTTKSSLAECCFCRGLIPSDQRSQTKAQFSSEN